MASLTLAGCGGCGGDDVPKLPDGPLNPGDAMRNCGSVTSGTIDFGGFFPGTPSSVLEWVGSVGGNLGDGNQLFYRFEFYSNVEGTLAGTFDLHAGNQTNYQTCAICIRAFAFNSSNQLVKQFYQSRGSITLTEDPFTNQHLIASLTDLQLEEVTINQTTYASTPVAGGACANFASYAIDHDRIPNAWTCAKTDYDEHVNCNCKCGTPDPDCTINTAPVMGCTNATDVCFADTCVPPVGNDTCATATSVTVGTPVTGTTAGALRNYSSGLEATTCTGFLQPGPDAVYSVAMTAGTQYTVTLSNTDAKYDGAIALVGPDDPALCEASPITACVKGADKALAGANETFTYTPTTGGTYFIIVDSFDINGGGAFTLSVTSP